MNATGSAAMLVVVAALAGCGSTVANLRGTYEPGVRVASSRPEPDRILIERSYRTYFWGIYEPRKVADVDRLLVRRYGPDVVFHELEIGDWPTARGLVLEAVTGGLVGERRLVVRGRVHEPDVARRS